MTSSTDIIAKFKAAFKTFKTTNERLNNMYVTQIYDAIANIFYPICYDSVGAKKNLIRLSDNNAAYATEYGKSFPCPACPGIYVSDIDTTKDAYLDSCKKEAFHKATIPDWEIYDMAESEANRFITRIVVDVWISPLSKGSPTFYANRMTNELLDQLQVVWAGHHPINLLALQDEMRTMHVTTNIIPQYMEDLEKAQLQSERADMLILDN